jgi:Flp pilus assembly protein TadD
MQGRTPAPFQTRGDQVEVAAEEWVRKPRAKPFFLFVHFYDLHGPFLLPKPWSDQYRGRSYDGEIAFVDSLIARLSSALGTRTVLLITADHGESLGDHGERNHGFFVYHSTTRVPLIMSFPDGRGAGKRVVSVVRLIDVAPTLLAANNLPPLRASEGLSLLDSIDKDSKLSLEAYSDPKDQIALYRRYQDALELQGSGRIEESAAGLQQVVSADPAIVGPRIEVGLTLQRLHRDSDAVKEFESALRVDPRNALVHFNLGVSLSNLGNDEKAERELDLATALQPSFSRSFVARGLALARMGKLREGVASLTAALTIDANDFDALYNRGNLLGALQQLDDSRRDLLQAVAIEPDSAPAHEALGTLAIYSGDDRGALREYQRAVALNPRSSTAHSGLGLLYLKLGQKDKASVELRKALELDPNNADARDALKK